MLPATQMLPIIQSGVQLRINGNHKFKEKDYGAALMLYMQVCDSSAAVPQPQTTRSEPPRAALVHARTGLRGLRDVLRDQRPGPEAAR